MILPLLVCVAFLTLAERKVLAFRQNRLGPNKVGFLGGLQPFRDAIKLFVKEIRLTYNSHLWFFLLSPCFMFIVVMFLMIFQPHEFLKRNLVLSRLLAIILFSSSVYPMFIIGWSSNSKYAFIGGIRRVAQTISYEISLTLIIIIFRVLFFSLKIKNFNELRYLIRDFQLCLVSLWFCTLLAELNRTPFDFSEGESELVSGFNVEFRSIGFVLIFLAEYASILFFSCVTSYCALGINLFSLRGLVTRCLIIFFIIIVRATLTRVRYDELIKFAWKSILPLSLTFFLIFVALGLLF